MSQLRDFWRFVLDNFRVNYTRGDQAFKNDNGEVGFNYLWQFLGKAPVVQFLRYARDQEREQFAPLVILRGINIETNEGVYVAPLTFTLTRDKAVFSWMWWAWFVINVSVDWEDLRNGEGESHE